MIIGRFRNITALSDDLNNDFLPIYNFTGATFPTNLTKAYRPQIHNASGEGVGEAHYTPSIGVGIECLNPTVGFVHMEFRLPLDW